MASFSEVYEEIRSKFPTKVGKYADTGKLLRDVLGASEDVNMLPEVERLSLTREDCEKLRLHGVKAFQKNKLDTSLACYGAYLEACHCMQKGRERAEAIYQGFSGRSTVLFRAEEFRLCADDIDAALEHSKDDTKEFLLLDRKAKCLIKLDERKVEAEKTFRAAVKAAEASADTSDKLRAAFIAQVEATLAKVKQVTEEDDGSKDWKCKQTSFFDAIRSQFPAGSVTDAHATFSSRLKIVYGGPDRGRYLTAATDIAPGEMIALERPLVGVAQFEHGDDGPVAVVSKACHNCQARLRRQVFHPSPVVSGVRFCSRECLRAAVDTYHRHEVFVLADYMQQAEERRRKGEDQAEQSGCMFLALRAVAERLPEEIKGCDSSKNPEFGCDNDPFDKYDFLDQLVGHETAMDGERKLKTAIRSVLLLKCLRQSGYFAQTDSKDPTKTEWSVLRRLHDYQLSMTFNIHTVYALSGLVRGDIPLRPVATGVYGRMVLFNHSCAHNTAKFFAGGVMVVVAKRFIAKGEEVSNNYGIHHTQMSLDERKDRLKSTYFFDCGCEACAGDYPLHAGVPSALPSKNTKKQLDKLLGAYQQSFAMEDFAQARRNSQAYLAKLRSAGVAVPHRNFEIGAVALDSSWWAAIERDYDV